MSSNSNYLFQSMKTYASNEWMAHGQKKYRTVFDKSEIDKIGVELALYNTKFNEEDWETDIEFFCYQDEPDPVIEKCHKLKECYIPQTESEVKFHITWKPSERNPLIKGNYRWVATINDKVIGETNFYIEEVGKVSLQNNPFFELQDIKLFKSTNDPLAIEERSYLSQFNADDTEYVWVQLDIKNKLPQKWFVEVFYNFHDDTGMLKESVSSFNFIEENNQEERFVLQAGWGQDSPGYWIENNYYIHIVFMDCLIGKVKLEFGNEDKEGIVLNQLDFDVQLATPDFDELACEENNDSNENKEVKDTINKLNALVGLDEIKTKVSEFAKYVDFVKIRKEQGFEEEEDFILHSIFTGNPGTGKTTVVKLLGQIFKQKGLLSKGHVHEVDRAALIGEYIGQTAPMTKKNIEKARGGILFIDEAYMLNRDTERDFGKEAVEVILKEMSEGPGDIAIMAAGYPDEMKKFMEMNPGLKSRFRYHYEFNDYTPDELDKITQFAAAKKGVNFTKEAQSELKEIIIDAYRTRDRSFGNARYATYLVDQAKIKLGLRALDLADKQELTKETLSTILPEDVLKLKEKTEPKKPNIPTDDELLHEALGELNNLLGMAKVKEEIHELVKLVNYYREMGKDVMNQFSFHTLFLGNPGTGKTTVARILGKIYKALGVLERGHIVETDREGLVAGYVAQTAPKTKQKIEEALDGVLFIDEAYALTRGANSNGFGQEAVEVLLKNMEDKRGRFVVIAAGYPDNMYQFLESNPGLQSRFDTVLNFNDYSADELYKIALKLFSAEKMYLDNDAQNYLANYMQHLIKMRSKSFGNAREVRKLVSEVIRNQNLRMADLPKEKRSPEILQTIILDDVDDFVAEPVVKKPAIGFNAKKI